MRQGQRACEDLNIAFCGCRKRRKAKKERQAKRLEKQALLAKETEEKRAEVEKEKRTLAGQLRDLSDQLALQQSLLAEKRSVLAVGSMCNETCIISGDCFAKLLLSSSMAICLATPLRWRDPTALQIQQAGFCCLLHA